MTNTPSIERLKELLAKATEPKPVVHGYEGQRELLKWNTRRSEAKDAIIYAALPHLIATLETLTPSAGEGSCELCAGKCRGHSLGHPEEWEPEPGSRASLASPPLPHPDIEGRARELRQLARKLGSEYGLGVMDDVLVALKGAADDLERLSLPTTEAWDIGRDAAEAARAHDFEPSKEEGRL